MRPPMVCRKTPLRSALQSGRKAPLLALAALILLGCTSLTPYEEIVAELPPENLIQVDGRRAYVEDRGEGEAVVLVHGFGSSTYSWRGVIPELARDFRVVSVDLPGFGFTERPTDSVDYTRFAQGEFLLGVADALGIDRFHLVGHSYGGAVGAALAVRRPERIASLTLLNAAARSTLSSAERPWPRFAL